MLGAQPVEGSAVDDGAADGVAVAAHELRQRVDDDVGADQRQLAVRERQAGGREQPRQGPLVRRLFPSLTTCVVTAWPSTKPCRPSASSIRSQNPRLAAASRNIAALAVYVAIAAARPAVHLCALDHHAREHDISSRPRVRSSTAPARRRSPRRPTRDRAQAGLRECVRSLRALRDPVGDQLRRGIVRVEDLARMSRATDRTQAQGSGLLSGSLGPRSARLRSCACSSRARADDLILVIARRGRPMHRSSAARSDCCGSCRIRQPRQWRTRRRVSTSGWITQTTRISSSVATPRGARCRCRDRCSLQKPLSDVLPHALANITRAQAKDTVATHARIVENPRANGQRRRVLLSA